MLPTITRRHFVFRSIPAGLSAAGLVAAASRTARAIDPITRPGSARLPLSLAAYSFRDYFQDSAHKQGPRSAAGHQIDLFQFVDFCAEHGCQGSELTSYYFPRQLTDDFLLKLKHHAFIRGLAISGTAVGNNFTLPPG